MPGRATRPLPGSLGGRAVAQHPGHRDQAHQTRPEAPPNLSPVYGPPPRPAIEHPREVHLHLHGVSAEDIAAILARRDGR